MRAFLFCLLAVAWPFAAAGAVLQATPATLEARVAAARSGDTVRLAPGAYIAPMMRRVSGITLDARGATVEQLVLRGASDVKIVGGSWRTGCPANSEAEKRGCPKIALSVVGGKNVSVQGAAFEGPGGIADGSGVFVQGGAGVQITETTFEGLAKGIRFRLVDGFAAKRIECANQRVDCITIASSWNGLVEDVRCRGTKVTSNEHPDCVQAWSRANARPTSDIVVRRLRVTDDTQGVGFFNHRRIYKAGTKLADGTVLAADTQLDDGGFGRVVVEDSEVVVSRPNGITVVGSRDLVLRNNRVDTVKGSRFRTKILTPRSVLRQRCGNSVGGDKSRQAADPAC